MKKKKKEKNKKAWSRIGSKKKGENGIEATHGQNHKRDKKLQRFESKGHSKFLY